MTNQNPPAFAQEEGQESISNRKPSYKDVLILSYQSLGVVYGDLSTSPLYVYKTTFSGKLRLHENDEEVLGVLSFIFWTFTLIPLVKYIYFVLSADDNGEGGTFALYSLLCRHARLSMFPNEQAGNGSLSAYEVGESADTWASSMLKNLFKSCPSLRNGLLIVVLLGTCMAIGDGVLTPAISVLSATSGIQVKLPNLHENYVVGVSCLILVALFSLQRYGTYRVGCMFAPIVIAWLLSIGCIGIYNIFRWNPNVIHALSPVYMYKFLRSTGLEGWVSLGGVVLCITGSETMFANLGHFSAISIRIAFTFLVYPCLLLAYMGEAAFLSRHHDDIQSSFYKSIPETVFWPVFIIATCAAIVGSQAVISATFSLVSQCCALSCFPPVKIVHTSNQIFGQIYIPEVNWILMCLCLTLTVGLRNTNTIGHAYGLVVIVVIFVTSFLMFLVMILVWKRKAIAAIAFLVFFGSIELVYVSASVLKIPQGGWIPLTLSIIFMSVMYIWYYGTRLKHEYDLQNKVSAERILASASKLGIVRVPGIGLVYTNSTTGVPAVFGHFAMNLPAFHQVLVFVCRKSVQVPFVPSNERFLVGRIGPKEHHMFRCIVRYGYKDLRQESYDFEDKLVSRIISFVEMEAGSTHQQNRSYGFEVSDAASGNVPVSTTSFEDATLVRPGEFSLVDGVLQKEESMEILRAKESGVVYITGASNAKAKGASSMIKKFAIDVVFAFLSKNCRSTDVVRNEPHSLLLNVAMLYHV